MRSMWAAVIWTAFCSASSGPFSNMNGSARCSVIVFAMFDGSLRTRARFPIRCEGAVNSTMRKQSMIRTIAIGMALAFSLATTSYAAMGPVPVGPTSDLTIKVAEGCGPGFWRGPGGRCHPFAQGRLCPPGYHIGPEGHRCWPN
jgi:hypothetical protein